ncbi:hypothetical protein IW262DRAFT_972317 [Armillaria fumosa]|nr:hypothetical protein IW262DRAFT_972317 [Armillaria fumosa]
MPTDAYAGQSVVAIFNCLQLLGLTLLLLVLLPALFSTRINRMRTWHTMILSGIIYNLCYLPLMILGQQTGPPPSFLICLFQSCLIYCAPVLLMSFALVFLIDVSSFFRTSFLLHIHCGNSSSLFDSCGIWNCTVVIGLDTNITDGSSLAHLCGGFLHDSLERSSRTRHHRT